LIEVKPMGLPDELWAFEDPEVPGACYRDEGIVYPGVELESARRIHRPDLGTRYIRADAMPTKEMIDRMVDALPGYLDWEGDVRLHENADPVGRCDIRNALYLAAGIEVPE
jgi:hypothetical protein